MTIFELCVSHLASFDVVRIGGGVIYSRSSYIYPGGASSSCIKYVDELTGSFLTFSTYGGESL